MNPLAWLRKRRRAERLGSSFRDQLTGGRVWYWWDPETGDVWLSKRRYALFSVEMDDTKERIEDRLNLLDSMDGSPIVIFPEDVP